MAGHEGVRAEPAGQPHHRRDPHLAVAEHAGVGRPPRRVPLDEGPDHAAPELLLEVEGEVRDAERMREPPRAKHRLGRAAGLRSVGARIGPELQRHRRHLGAALALEQRRDGAVHAAGHRDQHAAWGGRREDALRAGGGAERPVKRIGGELSSVALCRGEAAELGFDPVLADQRRLERRRAVSELSRGSGGGAGGAAALAREADPIDPRPREGEGDADQVAAGSTAGGAAEGTGGGRAQPRRVPQVVLESLPAHALRVERRRQQKRPQSADAASGLIPS